MARYILKTKILENDIETKISNFLENELGLIESKKGVYTSNSEYYHIRNAFFFYSAIPEDQVKELLGEKFNLDYVLINLDKKNISYLMHINKTAKNY